MYKQIIRKDNIKALLGTLRLSDEEAYFHSLEVAQFVDMCLQWLSEMNENEWTEEECEAIITGALLHDIGKAYLPFGLQHASKALDQYDRAIIQIHPILGYEAVKYGDFHPIVTDIILMHHAHADGTGYPVLDGHPFNVHNVPDYVWLVSYADKFEAMTNRRAYKRAMDYPSAWQELLSIIRNGKLVYKYTRVFSQVVLDYSILPVKEDS